MVSFVNKITKKRKIIFLSILMTLITVGLAIFFTRNKNDNSKGMMVLNTNRSFYSPGENIEISMAYLNKEGDLKCNTKLKLLVRGPKIKKVEISTENNKIYVSDTCKEDYATGDNSDYRAIFVPENEGVYKITLENTENGLKIGKRVKVKKDQKYTVERSGPTRVTINSLNRYYMALRVTSKVDFDGKLEDLIPPQFVVLWQGPAKMGGGKISWDISLKAGETKEFIYEYKISDTDIKTLSVGKASLYQNNVQVFEENSTWNLLISNEIKKNGI